MTAHGNAAAALAVPPARRPSPPGLAHGLLLLLIAALQFGPMVGLVGFRLTGDERWTWNGAARDVLVLALLLLAAVARLGKPGGTPLPRSARWALLLAAVYALLALQSDSAAFVVGLNLRRLVLVPLLFVALSSIRWTPAQVDRSFAWIVASSVAVALFGLAERFAPDSLWTELLDIDAFNAANVLDRFGNVGFQASGRFFSADLEPWTNGPLRRAVSTYLEPTTLAAAMAVLLVMGLARGARGHRATALVLLALACGVATVSKGLVLFLPLLLAWRWTGVPSPRHVWAITLVACAAASAVAHLQLDGPLVHVSGLASAVDYLLQGHWRGEGIGEAGNYTEAQIDFGEESGLGNVVGQVGVAALLSLAWLSALARDVLATAALRRDPGGRWIAAWLLFWTVTYLLSASSLGVGGNALGFALLALYLHPASGTGAAGAMGAMDAMGTTCAPGTTGTTRATGAMGAMGAKGAKGATGATDTS